MSLNNLFNKKPALNQKNITKMSSIVGDVLKAAGLDVFNNQDNFVNWVAENNANLFNVPIKTAFEKVNNYLIDNEYYRKNWISLFKRSKQGTSAYLIFSIEDNLAFQVINLSSRKYDTTGKLIEVTIFYEPYEKNSLEVLLYETYKLDNKKVTIKRYFYEMNNGKKGNLIKDEKFKDYILNDKLEAKQELAIDYLPVIPMRNKPNEEADCSLAINEIKMLDVFYEQIINDVLVNAPKFIFENIYGNKQSQIEDAVRKLITQNYLFITENKPVTVLEGKYKGKTLTDVIDWVANQIAKKIFLYVPSQKKSAQQTQGEAESVNIGTINAVEQKMTQYRVDTFNFIKTLINFDKDILQAKTFALKDTEITKETLKIEMDIINPATNQLESEYGTRQNNIS